MERELIEAIIGYTNTDVEDTIVHTSTSEIIGWINEVVNYSNKWISVSERIPEPNISVLCFVNLPVINCTYTKVLKYHKNEARGFWEDVNDYVTHWMPLPENPLTPKQQ